jgi:hypothetical protein
LGDFFVESFFVSDFFVESFLGIICFLLRFCDASLLPPLMDFFSSAQKWITKFFFKIVGSKEKPPEVGWLFRTLIQGNPVSLNTSSLNQRFVAFFELRRFAAFFELRRFAAFFELKRFAAFFELKRFATTFAANLGASWAKPTVSTLISK